MHLSISAKQKLIIACVGSSGSGKDTVVDHMLAVYKMQRISISDMVRVKATELCLSHTRENLNRISKEFIERYGNDYFSRLAIVDIQNSESFHIAVPDIRSPEDVKTFRGEFGKSFILLAVVMTDAKVRFERLLARETDRDPKSWDEFLRNEQREEEIFQITTTVSLADYVLHNDQGLAQLIGKVDLISANLKLPQK